MIKMELKNLTKSYEKGKIALDHLAAPLSRVSTAYLDQWGWKIDLNEPDYAEFRTR